jgi:hypothetical protein
MHSRTKVLLGLVVLVVIIGMVVFVTFHLGEVFALRVGQFAPLLGAFIGGGLVLLTVTLPTATKGALDWKGRERTSWLLMGLGIVAWGMGEAIWRSSVSLGRSAFPSFADSGYALFPLLAIISLLVKPSFDAKSRGIALLMESFILTGSLWSIAWYHVLGNLAQPMTGMSLAKILVLYYPASDIILLSYILFLLLHEQEDTYRSLRGRMSKLVVGLGLSCFVVSDFLFHIQQPVGMSVESPWIDLGRFLGLLTIGIAAYVGRVPLARRERHQRRPEEDLRNHLLSPLQFIPYGLLVWLFVVVIRNILATDSLQQAIRPVLLLSALTVFGLVMVRQIVTIREDRRVAQQQTQALEQLTQANRHMEEQAHLTAELQTELERDIEHLRNVQASLANGDLHARATLTHGALWPLAANLNLMAGRLARTAQDTQYAQRLVKTLAELSVALDRGMPLDIPASCYDFPEISQLVAALRVQELSSDTEGRMPAMPSFQTTRRQDLRQTSTESHSRQY